jgi:hypothetical protein
MGVKTIYSLYCDFCGGCIVKPQTAYKNDPMLLIRYGDHKVIDPSFDDWRKGVKTRYKCKHCLNKEAKEQSE